MITKGCDQKWRSSRSRFREAKRPITCAARPDGWIKRRPSGVALWPRSKKHLLDWRRGLPKASFKMERNLGRIQDSLPQAADLNERGGVKDSKEGPRLVWRQKPEQKQWLEARERAHLQRTNLTRNAAADLWKRVHAVVGSRSAISHPQERVGHPAALSSAEVASPRGHKIT